MTAFVLVLTSGLLALAGLALDGGLALAAKVRAVAHAESAARAGAQAIDLNAFRAHGRRHLAPAQVVADAHRYLATVSATGSVTVTDNTVTVIVTATHTTLVLGLVGITRLTVHGIGRAQPHDDVTGTP
ncbi:hypothetical protein NLX83_15665 [Allokutzneria sp. A3M-2-11 16]|uniref:pilus assembly protein TadG-related protein n=1 Tax=Allokutzneria sp. A3M-2-11 16 TaxID=2962043 RepID=UPI0020B68621|nr:pilus assembly protein TadG-related protein [Allokutzneria sp. A3M-2-11 16]MCP3800705.1 hypothetical protein [Allokutzneria sp. A3M-2-11 16]